MKAKRSTQKKLEISKDK
jgi:hypothetical protein